jgi:ribonuclease D
MGDKFNLIVYIDRMKVITQTKDLKEFCDSLIKSPFITVDTEFIRETTYWPLLCLIQVASSEEAAMIDPLAEGIDLSPFFEILQNPDIVKVMHGCRQDIEIFYNLGNFIPTPLFDTQIAAMACGFGDAVGYETLIAKSVGAKIDKGSRFTDWARRPLSKAQLEYAIADVTHLRDAYQFLCQQIEEKDRAAWVEEEMLSLHDVHNYDMPPELAYQRLKMQDRRPNVVGVLITVAAWREEQARERNIPRGRVIKDDAIREIAVQGPKNTSELSRLRSIPKGFENSRYAEPLLAAIQRGLNLPKNELPVFGKAYCEQARHWAIG